MTHAYARPIDWPCDAPPAAHRATFKLSNGYSVRTAPSGTDTEFTTLDPAGEVISTIYQGGEAAAELLTNLRVAERLAAL